MADTEAEPEQAPAGPPQSGGGGRGPGGGRDLVNGPIGKNLIAFAMPTLLSSIIQSANGSVNAIWIGRFIGEDGLAATSTGNMILFLLMAFVFGFGMASTILIGQAFGRRDIDGARRVMGTATGAFIWLAILIAVIGWTFTPGLVHLLATPGQAGQLAIDYLRMLFTAMPPILLMIMFMTALRGSGDAVTPLWFMIVAVILDAGLNPVFILGLGPIPAMGISGSAFATVISNWVSLFGLIAVIYIRDLPLRLRGPELAYLKPDPAILRTIVGKGFPLGLQMIVVSASGLALIGLVNREGVETAAAFGVAMQIWGYLQMPAMSLSAAVSAMAAQNIGAGRWDRIGSITRTGVIFHLVMTGVLMVLLTVVDRYAIGLFLGTDSAAVPIAQHIHLLATWSFLLFGVTLIIFGTVRANGAVIGPLIILAIGLIPVRFGFALGAYPWLGADALWLSFVVGSIVNMGLSWAFYAHGGWRKTSMAPPPSREQLVEESEAAMEPGGRLNPSA